MRILKVIGLLLEYPDELLWENRDDALALIRADVPSLTPFVGELLTAPLLIAVPNGARCSSAGAPPRCCCLNMCMPNPATAARRWST